MIFVGSTKVPLLYNEKMGIQRAYVGENKVYEREGSYLFVELFGTNGRFIPKGSTGLITADGDTFFIR